MEGVTPQPTNCPLTRPGRNGLSPDRIKGMTRPVDPWEGQPYFPGQPDEPPTDPIPRGRHRRQRDAMDQFIWVCWLFIAIIVIGTLLRLGLEALRPLIITHTPLVIPS